MTNVGPTGPTGEIGLQGYTGPTGPSLGPNLEPVVSGIQDEVASLNTRATIIDTSMNTVEFNILTKQNRIDSNHNLGISYINFSESSLQHIDISGSLSSTLSSIQTDIEGVNTQISRINIAIQNLETDEETHLESIDEHLTAIQSLQTGKQNIIDATNKLSSVYVSVGLSTLTDTLTVVDTSLNYLSNEKQDTITSENKLRYDYIDFSGSSLVNVDISLSLQSQITTINSSISALQGFANGGDTLSFLSIADHFDVIDASFAFKQDKLENETDKRLDALKIGTGEVSNTKLNYLQNVTADIQTQINNLLVDASGSNIIASIDYSSETLTTTIANNTVLTHLAFSGDNSIQTTAFTSSKDNELIQVVSDMSNVLLTVSDHTSRIESIITDISGIYILVDSKQNTIDPNNQILASGVDYSASHLRFVDEDISQNLSITFSSMNSSILSLQTSDLSQANFISSFSSDISYLQIGKQDAIHSSNLLAASLISYGVSSETVSSQLDTINTTLGEKANSTGATLTNVTFSGTISGLSKTNVGLGSVDNTADSTKPVSTTHQSALNLKADLSGGATFTGILTSNSNIEFTGTSKLKYASGASGQVLTSDNNGLLSLQPPYVVGADFSANYTVNGSVVNWSYIELTAGTWMIWFNLGIKADTDCSGTLSLYEYYINSVGPTSTSVATILPVDISNGVTATNGSPFFINANDQFILFTGCCLVTPTEPTTTYYNNIKITFSTSPKFTSTNTFMYAIKLI